MLSGMLEKQSHSTTLYSMAIPFDRAHFVVWKNKDSHHISDKAWDKSKRVLVVGKVLDPQCKYSL